MTVSKTGSRAKRKLSPAQVARLARILEALKKKGKDQAWLAAQLEVAPATMSRYMSGDRVLTIEDLSRIAKILGVPGKDLITF